MNSPSTPANPSLSRQAPRIKLALAWLFGLGLLAWLLARAPLGTAMQALSRPAWTLWLLTLAALLLSYALRAARVQVVLGLGQRQESVPRWFGLRLDALRVILLHNAAVNLLPMRAGELSFPWLASRELSLPVPRAVVCLLWMRLQDLAVLLGLGLALWPALGWPVRLAGLLALVVGWRMGWLALRVWGQRHPEGPGHATSRWARLASQLQASLMEKDHHRPSAWILTLGNWSLKLAAGATLLSAITQAPWTTAWSGALGGELAAVVPLQGPAGFGTYEAGVWAGMAALLPVQSAALKQAVGAALALHLCFLVCAVVAALLAAILPHPRGRRPGQEGSSPGQPG